ncbi:MAG: glutathione synthetase [Saprospiraceae bacterium]|nr:glutathione synthetase [Saprospiraceae bacterium]
MMKYNVLVLTDHSRHSDQNSIYAILDEMVRHPQCKRIDVISRGIEKNGYFFMGQDDANLFGTTFGHQFKFTEDSYHFKKDLHKVHIKDYDIILMRLPRPVADSWLEWLMKTAKHAVIINNPLGIIKTSSKKYLLNFPEQCPDMKLCNSISDVLEMAKNYPIVLKPLREYGGKGIVRIEGGKVDTGNKSLDINSYLTSIENDLINDGYLGMKFLKNVRNGDKRILVVGGEIMACSLRIPAHGSWLCNVSQGGQSVKSDVTPEEVDIINAIAPKLLAEGILIFGVDTLEDDNGKRILSEVNTLSIGGFPQAQKQSGKPIIKMTIDKIFEYADR